MSQAENLRSYRGVACLYCTRPIPISPLIAQTEAEQENETTSPKNAKCQVFHLRCPACGKEKPYKISEILEFEGASPNTPRIEPASAYSRYSGIRSKAASA